MKKSDKKYRQGRSKDRQSVNEEVATYTFILFVIALFTLILYNLSLSL